MARSETPLQIQSCNESSSTNNHHHSSTNSSVNNASGTHEDVNDALSDTLRWSSLRWRLTLTKDEEDFQEQQQRQQENEEGAFVSGSSMSHRLDYNTTDLDRLVNLSRDDSDVGGEYFLRDGGGGGGGTPPDSAVLTMVEESGDEVPELSTTRTSDSDLVALLTRRASSHSLYGEAIEAATATISCCDNGGHREFVPDDLSESAILTEQVPRYFSNVVRDKLEGHHKNDNDDYHRDSDPFFSFYDESAAAAAASQSSNVPLLQPQFRCRTNNEFDSVSDSSCCDEDTADDDENDFLSLSPGQVLLTPSLAADESSNVTPPSILYPCSLSPPPLTRVDSNDPNDMCLRESSQQQLNQPRKESSTYTIVQTTSTARSTCSSQGSVVVADSASTTSQQAQKPTSFVRAMPFRPPRAPHVTLRFQEKGGHGQNSSVHIHNHVNYSSNPNTVSSISSMSSIVATNKEKVILEQHCRAPSNGDDSVLSALTDIDFDANCRLQAPGVISSLNPHTGLIINNHVHPIGPWDRQTHPSEQQAISGMDIDVPCFLQQPILCDDGDGSDIVNNSKTLGSRILNENSSIGQNENDKKEQPMDDIIPQSRTTSVSPNVLEFEELTTHGTVTRSVCVAEAFNESGHSVPKSMRTHTPHDQRQMTHLLRWDNGMQQNLHISTVDLFLNNSLLASSGATTLFPKIPKESTYTTPSVGLTNSRIKKLTSRKAANSAISGPIASWRLKFLRFAHNVAAHLLVVEDIMRQRNEGLTVSFMKLLVRVTVPSLCCACLLYYGCGNPSTRSDYGINDHSEKARKSCASISWWIIFVGVRHPLIWHSARALEAFFSGVVKIVSTHLEMTGDNVAEVLAQSRGWPAVLMFYSLLSFLLLAGNTAVASHWMFWQSYCSILSTNNSASTFLAAGFYNRILALSFALGLLSSAKRAWLGRHLGRRMVGTTYLRRSLWYLNCLFYRAHQARYCTERYGILVFDLIENIESVRRVVQLSPSFPSSVKVEIDPFSDRGETNDDHFEGENDVSPLNNSGNLEKEESRRKTWTSFRNNGSVDDFIAFREAVAFLQTDLPFSRHFGDVLERDHNDESVYVVYNRLCHDQNGLPFHCLCNCPRSSVGAFENNRMRRLRHLFQPNDDGIVTMQSFLSVFESTYKEQLNVLAKLQNAYSIERQYETMLHSFANFVFLLTGCTVLGLDIMKVVQPLLYLTVTFALCVGSTDSAIFEGLLMILTRRPFDVGDRIVLAKLNDATEPLDRAGWIVQDFGLFFTTCRCNSTNKISILANGHLSRGRIIKMS